MLSKLTFAVAAASAGIVFIGYCIYFDKKRRNDPNFKQKLREKRRKALENKKKNFNSSLGLSADPSKEEMHRFFMQEIQKGEELLSTGDIDDGAEHLSNAVAVCAQPHQLLTVFQQTLPPQVFQLLCSKLHSVGSRLSGTAGGDSGPTITDVTESGVIQDEVVD